MCGRLYRLSNLVVPNDFDFHVAARTRSSFRATIRMQIVILAVEFAIEYHPIVATVDDDLETVGNVGRVMFDCAPPPQQSKALCW